MANVTKPIITQFEITDRCNFFCPHCYHLEDTVDKRVALKTSDEIIMQIANKIIENEIFNVVLTGGEPLLKKNVLQKLIELLLDNGRNVSLNTNLSLVDDAFIDYIAHTKLNSLLVSCPSTDPEIYEKFTGGGKYTVFFKNLKTLIDSGLHFTVNMVVNQHNLHSIRDTASDLKKMGVKFFGATPMGLNALNPQIQEMLSKEELLKLVYDLIWVEENLGLTIDIIEALPKCIFPEDILDKNYKFLNRRCQAGKTVVTISSNGDVRPCAHNPDSYGNILDKPLSEIYENMKDWRDFTFMPEKCMDCDYLTSCFGGCRINAYLTTGNKNGDDFWSGEPIKVQNRTNRVQIENDFNEKTLLRINKRIISRKDGDYYLVGNKNINNLLVVNKEFYDFVSFLKEHERLTIGQIADLTSTNVDDKGFRNVINTLLNKRYIFYV